MNQRKADDVVPGGKVPPEIEIQGILKEEMLFITPLPVRI